MRRRPLFGFGVVLLLAACASLPPARPVTNLNQLAGTWQGVNTVGDSVEIAIQPDGRFSGAVTEKGVRVPLGGDFRLEGSRVTWDERLYPQAATGTATLHEEPGHVILAVRGATRSGVQVAVDFKKTR